MFCKLTTTETHVIVTASLIGRFLRWITFGWYMPSITFRRDFGTGCFDGRCLQVVDGRIRVSLEGNVTMKPPGPSGGWGDFSQWTPFPGEPWGESQVVDMPQVKPDGYFIAKAMDEWGSLERPFHATTSRPIQLNPMPEYTWEGFTDAVRRMQWLEYEVDPAWAKFCEFGPDDIGGVWEQLGVIRKRPRYSHIVVDEQIARNMGKTLKSDFLVRFSGMPVYTFPGIGGGYLFKGSY